MIPAGPTTGAVIGARYELVEPVASGGMAQVWRAVDLVLGRDVAVKVLHPHLAGDRAFLLRFRREAVAAARLSHPGIVAIYDTVSDDGTEAIVMELHGGGTLRREMAEVGRLRPERVRAIGIEVAGALEAAHRAGVVHRDIKPSNILTEPESGEHPTSAAGRVKVTDFGIAKAGEDTDLTVTGALLGTAKYLSPEQVAGDAATPRSDLYSLGLVLYEALAGQPPFTAESDSAVALRRLHEPARPVREVAPDAPRDLAGVIDRLVQRDPLARFPTAREVRLALLAVGHDRDAALDDRDPTVVDTDLTTISSRDGDVPGFVDGSEGPSTISAARPALADPPDDPGVDDLRDVDDDADDGHPGGLLGTERGWLAPALLIVLIGVGLVVAALLLSRSPLNGGSENGGSEDGATIGGGDGQSLAPTEEIGAPIVASSTSFDPLADQEENEQTAAFAVDGDESTSWKTETYRRADFGGLKSGVGLLIGLESRSVISEAEIVSPGSEWSVEVYVAEEVFGDDPASWGEPVGRLSGSGSGTSTSLADADGERIGAPPVGGFVLIWVTDPGTTPPGEEHRFELAELVLR